MSKFQVFATTRTGRKRIFTKFPEYSYSRPWKTNKKKFHIQWILVGLLFGLNDRYLKRVSNIYPCNMYTGLWVSFVFRLSPQLWMHLRATSGRILMNLFFRRHGSTRVRMYLVILQSNILVHTLFQVEVTTVTSVHFSERNLTRTEKHFRFQVWFPQE